MPDAFGRLTPEEERMLRAKMSPNMINQSAQPTSEAYALADQDFTGREAALAQQMRMGQEGMMAPLAKGKQAGDVYVGPTWSEGLDTAFQRAMGGYQMGQAMKGRKGLQQARDDQSQAAGVIGNYERDQAATQQGVENDARTAAAALDSAGLSETIRANQAKEAAARDTAAADAGERDLVYFHNPDYDPENENSSPTLSFYKGKGNNVEDFFGDRVDVENMTPFRAGTAGSGATARPASLQKKDEERAAIQGIIGESITKIDELAAEGKGSSGLRSLAIEYVPETLKGLAENALFEGDEQTQRAANVFIDAQIKEAISTGVLSDQDIKRLAGLNIAAPGLTPEQQVIRLSAISDILGQYDITLEAPPAGYFDNKPPRGRSSGRGSGAKTGKTPPPAKTSVMTTDQTNRLAELRKKRDRGEL
jgi:hypothetical protein